MTDVLDESQLISDKNTDSRVMLADWANNQDEWVRYLVSEIILSGGPVSASGIDYAYQLFRQEKTLEQRTLPQVEPLTIESSQDETAPELTLTRISKVRGVNALVSGAVIEPNSGLTILYGENGTGKTGYSRIFKALANSRTADSILGNIDNDDPEEPSATIDYQLGSEVQVLQWNGELGTSPFTRMSIFDSPAVRTHVDNDLDYVYTPVSLTLFNDINEALQSLSSKIDSSIAELSSGSQSVLSRFQRGSTIYPFIETLGASTELPELRSKSRSDDNAPKELESLTQTVAALQSNTIGSQIIEIKSYQRSLTQSLSAADTLLTFDTDRYNSTLTHRAQLKKDYEQFRGELFAAADLPAEPEETWNDFIDSGDSYRKHLIEVGAHDSSRCLYCRQPLLDPARDLLARYSSYLEDKISEDTRSAEIELSKFKLSIESIQSNDTTSFLEEYRGRTPDDRPSGFLEIDKIEQVRSAVSDAVTAGQSVESKKLKEVPLPRTTVESLLTKISEKLAELEIQQANRVEKLGEKKIELLELRDAIELGKSWPQIESQVGKAKEIDQLTALRRPLASLARSVTELAKTASDQLINQSFDELFLEECDALRAPVLKIQFMGREGKAQRRKVLNGKHKPSQVLSEGEQKVLALADFLAEARLSGINAPVIFDDPVSSLDHRRVNEVANRITRLAEENQVIVFTHDILFATTLLTIMDKSKRCSLFQITDENGKGRVSIATGLRTDSLRAIKGRINTTIQAALAEEDVVIRDGFVRQGYSHIRAWCEVFTEEELLGGVTKRYQPNVQMTTLPQINGVKLDEIGPKVTEIFKTACRYIEGHSQPLPTLGVSPTVSDLEKHWSELQELKRQYSQT